MNDLFNFPDFDPPTTLDARKRPDGAVRPGAVPPAATTLESGGGAVAPTGQAGVRRPDDSPRKADGGYYNTTRLTGRALAAAKRDAMTQEDRIRKLFDTMGDGWTASPSKVHQLVGGKSPITSTRRAITDLTDDGVLTRTDVQVSGPHGRPEYTWRMAINSQRRAA